MQCLGKALLMTLISWGVTEAESQVTRARDFSESAVVRWLLQLWWEEVKEAMQEARKTASLTFYRSNV